MIVEITNVVSHKVNSELSNVLSVQLKRFSARAIYSSMRASLQNEIGIRN